MGLESDYLESDKWDHDSGSNRKNGFKYTKIRRNRHWNFFPIDV